MKRSALPTHSVLLRIAGLFTWGLVGIPVWLRSDTVEALHGAPGSALLWSAFLLYGVCFWFLAQDAGTPRRWWVDLVLLLLLTAATLLLSHLMQSGIGAILLMLCAGVLPWRLSWRYGMLWMVAQNFAMLPIFALAPRFSWAEALLQCALYLGCSGFLFMASLIAKQQSEAREQLRLVNAELRATQRLLAENERTAERLRISRELHDLIGHHLTALSLNLEVAAHLSEGKAQQHVRQAQTLSKLLLADVREVVSTLREHDGIDLGESLRMLVHGIPEPVIHLSLPERLELNDPKRAQTVVRLTQEVLTNTVRHARARNLWLSYRIEDGALIMAARDDGRGAAGVMQGNGLRGMRERLGAIGGSLEINTAPGAGFSLAARLPLEVSA